MRSVVIVATGCLLTLAACQSPANVATREPASPPPTVQSNGEYLADALCMGCHTVADDAVSPVPGAPSFVSIANRDGLTREKLAIFLRDSYSFPIKMEMELSAEDADAIADYIMTLRDAEALDAG